MDRDLHRAVGHADLPRHVGLIECRRVTGEPSFESIELRNPSRALMLRCQLRKSLIEHGKTPLAIKPHIGNRIGWCGSIECEKRLKEIKSSPRVIVGGANKGRTCFACGAASKNEILVARCY